MQSLRLIDLSTTEYDCSLGGETRSLWLVLLFTLLVIFFVVGIALP